MAVTLEHELHLTNLTILYHLTFKVFQVRRLDSDVHQLVYENYNKFLTATNTVRKIQDEFNELENVRFLCWLLLTKHAILHSGCFFPG